MQQQVNLLKDAYYQLSKNEPPADCTDLNFKVENGEVLPSFTFQEKGKAPKLFKNRL